MNAERTFGGRALEPTQRSVAVTAEQLWHAARNGHGRPDQRRAPSAGIGAVLLALRGQPECAAVIAERIAFQRISVHQWLHKLEGLGFAEIDFVIQGSGGGRAAEFWTLTPTGRVLAEALDAEQRWVS